MLNLVILFVLLFFSIFFRGNTEAGFSFIYISIAMALIVVVSRFLRVCISPSKVSFLLCAPLFCYLTFCMMLFTQAMWQPNMSQYIFNYWVNISAIFLIITALQILLVNSNDFSRDLALVFYFAGTVTAANVLFDFIKSDSTEFYRASFWASRNTASIGLAISFLSGIYLLIENKSKFNNSKILFFAGLALILFGLILSGSRTASIGAFIGLTLILSAKIKTLFALLNIFLLFIALFILINLTSRDLVFFLERFSIDGLSQDLTSRYFFWIKSLELILGNGFFGAAHIYYSYDLLEAEPHNFLISILLFLGYGSVALFLTINLYVLMNIVFRFRYVPTKTQSTLRYSFAIYACLCVFWLAGGDPAKDVLSYIGFIFMIVFLYRLRGINPFKHNSSSSYKPTSDGKLI